MWVSWCKNKSFWQRFTCTEIPTGEIVSYIEDPGFHFESSYFSDGDLEGEYQVTLEFNGMVEEENHNSILSVTNGLGTTNYTLFKGGVISEGIFWFGPILKLRIMKSSKGQYISKAFFLRPHCPKNEQNIRLHSAIESKK